MNFFLDFLRTIRMLFFCIVKRFYHEPLLARKIEQSLPACTFLTLNKLSILSYCLSKWSSWTRKIWLEEQKVQIAFSSWKSDIHRKPQVRGGGLPQDFPDTLNNKSTFISSSSFKSFPTNTGTSLASTTPSVPGLMWTHISIALCAFLLAWYTLSSN